MREHRHVCCDPRPREGPPRQGKPTDESSVAVPPGGGITKISVEPSLMGLHMDAEDLGVTSTTGPNCAGVRDLIVSLLASHPLVTRVGAITEYRADVGLRAEIGRSRLRHLGRAGLRSAAWDQVGAGASRRPPARERSGPGRSAGRGRPVAPGLAARSGKTWAYRRRRGLRSTFMRDGPVLELVAGTSVAAARSSLVPRVEVGAL